MSSLPTQLTNLYNWKKSPHVCRPFRKYSPHSSCTIHQICHTLTNSLRNVRHTWTFPWSLCITITLLIKGVFKAIFHCKAECTVSLLNEAGRNNHPHNHKFMGNTGNRTLDLWLDKCISNQQLYHLRHSATLPSTR